MKISRPSPALIVSIVALVVACAGTATAASVLIKNSSQIATGAVTSSDVKNGSLIGADLKNRTVTGSKIAANTIGADKLAPVVRNTLQGQGLTGTEAVRKAGPENVAAGGATITRITQLQPGTYFLAAKTTITGVAGDLGLGELLRPNKTASAECTLEVGGDVDKARTVVASPGAETPQTVNLQMTRTIGAPTDAILTCSVTNVPWRASDSSIVALKLQGSTRVDTAG
ncbi:hypothetical protein GKE82_07720 [Conexibacter sp. W3-3-2]|uniref:Uncharacterized protein n=1 Tax=Paraconexibacter algicola TaxID=2133960 RepID=A0A2T4UFP8_9ACTN|nr:MULTISPECIES: hypothetical protein [Solirubrobacterales]MTD44192.1 hypothetical protein [Conexibacter sp. W3-3-2]PTL56614.1 hypothetical protein C7Y72_16840 [Paraconexibacter algicola]